MRPKGQKVALAFLGSLLLHGIVLGLFALIVALRPPSPPTPPADDEPVKLEIAQEDPPDTPPPVTADEATPTPKPRKLVEATGPDSDSPPPTDAALADRNSQASSPEESAGLQPGATQSGRKMASFHFDPRPPAPGLVSKSDNPDPTPLPQTAPVLPQPDRKARQPAAAPTPRPAPPVPTPDPDEFAMAMSTPRPTPEDPFDPSIRSTSPPLPKPATGAAPISSAGSISSAQQGRSAVRGAGGVDTMATPASRYTHQATQTIKAIWQQAVDRRDDQTFGSVIVHCTIDKDGLVLSPHIVSNTGDTLLGSIAYQAVTIARLPPMPADAVQEVNGKLALDITFEVTLMPQEAAVR